MRIVLELGDWVLAEDDAGEVRLWSNGVTGETRQYEDVPPEVEVALSSDGGPPPRQPAAAAQPQNAQPFRRERGLAAEASAGAAAVAFDGAAAAGDAKSFTRQRGLEAAPQAQYGAVASTLQPSDQTYAVDASASVLPPQIDVMEAGPPMSELEATAALQEASAPMEAMFDSGLDPSVEPEEPEPVATKPKSLYKLPSREPTSADLEKATTMKPYKNQSREQFLSKLTHLHLSERGLTGLGPAVNLCPRLKVLNLERNHLQELPGIQISCESLHMQGNDVWDLSGWTQNLPHLTTLELAENRLTVLSGLRRCSRLEVLSLRGQRSEKPLLLFPPTLRVFARSLRALDIARNRMADDDFAPVASLRMLERLDAGSNMLTDMPVIGTVLQALPQLNRLCLSENPVCWMRKYRDLVIVSAGQSLRELDSKEIGPQERPFLVAMHQRRQRRHSSEPPPSNDSPSGSTPTSMKPAEPQRHASVPRPPQDQPSPPPCFQSSRNRSRSSSQDPAGRHYRKRSSAMRGEKLPPLIPRG